MAKLVKTMFAALLGIFILAACTPQAAEEGSADTTETEAVTETPAEDAAKRPSPKKTVSGKVGEATITIEYGSPAVKGRQIWGELVPNDAVWRTGANEATTIEFSQDVTINGAALPKGKYSLFTIPKAEGPWTVVFNKTWNQWGAYSYDPAMDALRAEASPQTGEHAEALVFSVEDGVVTLAWEKKTLQFKVAAAAAS